MIYYKNNTYYIKQGNLYYEADIVVKNHTILINKTDTNVTDLKDYKELTYEQVKSRFIKKESTDVGSLDSSERNGKSIWNK